MQFCRTRFILLAVTALAASALLAPGAAALSVDVGAWSGPALPGTEPATAEVTVSYACGELLPGPVGPDIEVTLEPQAGALGSFSISEETLAVQSVGDCTPGEEVNENLTLSYTANTGQLQGSSEGVTVRVAYNISDDADPLNRGDERSVSASVGPYLNVVWSAVNDTFEVIGGDTVRVEVELVSTSNTEIMAMPRVELPMAEEGGEEWGERAMAFPRVPSPLAEGDGTAMVTFDVVVPAEASGEHELFFTAFVHSPADMEPYLESEPVEIPLTFTVTPLSVAEGDTQDGPGPAVAILLVVVAMLVALRRHRR